MKKLIALVLSVTMLGTISVSAALPKYNQFNANGGKFYNTSNKKTTSVLKVSYSSKPRYGSWEPRRKKYKYAGETVYKRSKKTVFYRVQWKNINSVSHSVKVNKKSKTLTIKPDAKYTDVGDYCEIHLKNKKNKISTTKKYLFNPEGPYNINLKYTKQIKQIKVVFYLKDSFNKTYKTKTITKAV